MKQILFLLLFLWGFAQADTVSILLESDPAGAVIVDQYGNEIGTTGTAFPLELGPYGSNLEVTLQLEGYEPKLERIKVRQLLNGGRYPLEGAIALRATSNWVSAKAILRSHPLLLGTTCVGIFFAGGLTLGRRKKTRKQLKRATVLEQAKARSADLKDTMVGAKLGRFRLTDLLGQGGTAKVYRALPDDSLDQSQAVAVKVLHPETEHDSEFRKRFEREVTIWKNLMHPNIVTFLDWSEHDGITYLVTELLEGETLRSEYRKGPRSPVDAMALLSPVFEAVSYAHKLGIAHRDLKPENILLTKDGQCKVADFGLARTGVEDRVTRTGTWVGTPEYISPEQVKGSGVDPRTDQYALGAMLYELVTGKPPFQGDDQLAIIFKVVASKPAPLKSENPDLPEEFCSAVERMLAKLPGDRFADLDEALGVLRDAC